MSCIVFCAAENKLAAAWCQEDKATSAAKDRACPAQQLMLHRGASLSQLFSCVQANENHGLLAPDSSWMDPPGWDVNRELLLNAAALQPWHNRTSKLVFRGAPNGMRQWMLGPELSSLR